VRSMKIISNSAGAERLFEFPFRPVVDAIMIFRQALVIWRCRRLAKRVSSTRIAYACNGFIGIHRLAPLNAAALVIAALAFRTTTEVSRLFRRHLRLLRALRNTAHTLSANRPFARTVPTRGCPIGHRDL
jgi:hypothetical protein